MSILSRNSIKNNSKVETSNQAPKNKEKITRNLPVLPGGSTNRNIFKTSVDIKVWYPVIISGFFLIAIILSMLFVKLLYGKEIKFDPSKYINYCVEYLISASVVVFGFLLTHILWIRDTTKKANERFKFLFTSYLEKAKDIVWNTNVNLSDYSKFPDPIDKTINYEATILLDLKRLGDIRNSVNSLLCINEMINIRDERLFSCISFYQSKIEENFWKLTQYKYIGPDNNELITILTETGIEIKTLFDYLKGNCDGFRTLRESD
jgi:hypothetical protein